MVLIFISVFNTDSKSIDTLKLKKNKKFYTFLAVEGIVLTGGITYLSKQLSYIADHNKANGKSTRLTKDGKYVHLAKEGNKELGYKNIEREMRREFGENAEDEAIKWLMKYKKWIKIIPRDAYTYLHYRFFNIKGKINNY